MKSCDNFLIMSQLMILFQIEVYPQRWQRYRLLSDSMSVGKSSPMRRVSLTRFSLLLWSSESEPIFVLYIHFTFPGSQGGVWGDPTWCSRRWSVQEAQFAVHWKVGPNFHLGFEILENCIRALRWSLFFCFLGSSPTSPTSASSR